MLRGFCHGAGACDGVDSGSGDAETPAAGGCRGEVAAQNFFCYFGWQFGRGFGRRGGRLRTGAAVGFCGRLSGGYSAEGRGEDSSASRRFRRRVGAAGSSTAGATARTPRQRGRVGVCRSTRRAVRSVQVARPQRPRWPCCRHTAGQQHSQRTFFHKAVSSLRLSIPGLASGIPPAPAEKPSRPFGKVTRSRTSHKRRCRKVGSCPQMPFAGTDLNNHPTPSSHPPPRRRTGREHRRCQTGCRTGKHLRRTVQRRQLVGQRGRLSHYSVPVSRSRSLRRCDTPQPHLTATPPHAAG